MSEISVTVRTLMILSGMAGLAAFLLANFYLKGRKDLRTIIGLVQIGANSFVFISWLNGFLQTTPGTIWKLGTLVGFTVPVLMASITFARVILPAFKHRNK